MKNVIITILVILVLGLGGFIIYDKVIKTPKDVYNKTNEVDNKCNDAAALEELETINPRDVYLLGDSYYLTKNSNIKLNDLSDSKLFYAIKNKVSSEKIYNFEGHEEYQCDGPALRYKTDDVLKQIEAMFGKKKKESFDFNSLVSNYITYNAQSKTIDVLPFCGASITPHYVMDIDKIEIDKNEKVVLYETVEYYIDDKLETTSNLIITYVKENGKYRFESAETIHLNNR